MQPGACLLSTCDPVNGPSVDPCPAPDLTVSHTVFGSLSFLFAPDGGTALQVGVKAGTIVPAHAAALRGMVTDTASNPIPGVTVALLGHSEFGSTSTMADGSFTMVVNGGGTLIVTFSAAGYLPAQRAASAVRWNDYGSVAPVALTALDPKSTVVALGDSATGYQVAQGTTQTDSSGSRTATLLFPPGTTASYVVGDAGTPVTTPITVRATEYTVGDAGPLAMPADVAPNTVYTYAANFSVDEAPAGARVVFGAPIIFYNDNFLSFPAGTVLPTGYFDQTSGQWKEVPDGIVVDLLSVEDGVGNVDITGDGVPDGTAALERWGITSAELAQLATMYSPPKSLWRATIPHFCDYDMNMGGGGGPGDGGLPGLPGAYTKPKPNAPQCPTPDPSASATHGSTIECQNGILRESIPLEGTPYSLVYSSDRVQGYTYPNSITIPLTPPYPVPGPPFPNGVQWTVNVAGQTFTYDQIYSTNGSVEPPPGQEFTWLWDGLDSNGNIYQGSALAQVQVGFVYPWVNTTQAITPAYNNTYGHFGYYGLEATTTPTRQNITLWYPVQGTAVGHWSTTAQGLGGWTLDVQNVYDVPHQALVRGDGTEQSGTAFGYTINLFAGKYSTIGTYGGDGLGPLAANFNFPWNVSVAPNGDVFIADRVNCRIRKVTNGVNGTITTVAGNGTPAYSGDNGAATEAAMDFPEDVTVDTFKNDGGYYIADSHNHRVRYVDAAGIIHTIAGTGLPGATGDNGPASLAELNYPNAVAVAMDGSLYISDSANCAIRRVDPAGIISTVAGTLGKCGCRGDNGPATSALLEISAPPFVTPKGDIYFADRLNNLVRKVSATSGIVTTVVGQGCGPNGRAAQAGFSPDGTQATAALLKSKPSASDVRRGR
jgi:hypothetical protein